MGPYTGGSRPHLCESAQRNGGGKYQPNVPPGPTQRPNVPIGTYWAALGLGPQFPPTYWAALGRVGPLGAARNCWSCERRSHPHQPLSPVPLLGRILCQDFSRTRTSSGIIAASTRRMTLAKDNAHTGLCRSGAVPRKPLPWSQVTCTRISLIGRCRLLQTAARPQPGPLHPGRRLLQPAH